MTGNVTGPETGGEGAGEAAEALSIAKELRELIKAILEKLTDAVRYGRRTRLMSWGLALSVGLGIGLTVITGAVLIHQAHTSQAIHRSQLEACGIRNGFHTRQLRR